MQSSHLLQGVVVTDLIEESDFGGCAGFSPFNDPAAAFLPHLYLPRWLWTNCRRKYYLLQIKYFTFSIFNFTFSDKFCFMA